ncbi:MAG: PD-(D/E)XK nuclease family protein [Chloroflexi bacterium]|nr:PD-(D/E)XK nuclease family protein [Chloroflexota bacterium]
MTQAVTRSGPYIWVTWLSKLLVGDASCEWAAWFKAHHKQYAKMPSAFDFVGWQMNHTELLRSVWDNLDGQGLNVLTEKQNSFNIRGSSGTMLGGRPDLVALSENETGGTVYDVKTGQPSAADQAQVMIYMYALPHWNRFRGMEFDGKVVYRDHEISIPHSAVDDAFKERLFALIGRISSQDPSKKAPSFIECRFCELTPVDCPERVDDEPSNEDATEVADF